MKRMVYITKADIAAGKMKCSDGCPVAIAASRAFHRKMGVGTVTITEINGPLMGDLPKAIRRFIAKFDHCRPVTPTRFACELTPEWKSTAK